MSPKPKKWIAALLGFFIAPLAFLYVGAPRLAGLSFLTATALGITSFMMPGMDKGLAFSVSALAIGIIWTWLAYRIAGRVDQISLARWYSRWYGMLGIIAAFVVVVLTLRAFLYEPYRAPSSSMMPALPIGSNIIVQKWGYGHYGTYGLSLARGAISAPLERGDIIVFDYPRDRSQTWVKRLVGMPGDKITYRDKRLFINGVDVRGQKLDDYLDANELKYFSRYREALGKVEHEVLFNDAAPAWLGNDAYSLPQQCTVMHETIQCEVPLGNYFVLGDNRDNSADSRFWGFVPADAVIGKVAYIRKPRG